MSRKDPEDAPESDAFPDAPHPRFAERLVGHRAAEAEMLEAYRSGRLAHAWLIGGPEGVGKATLAWRFARFALSHPDPAAPAVRDAADLSTPADASAARHLANLAHPDFALIRREWQAGKKSMQSEIPVEGVRAALQMFHLSAAFGGWRVCLVDCAEDLNRSSANALLKMIEEPPERALILIVSHRPGHVLATIRSRCRRIRLEPLAPDEIVEIVAGSGPPWSEMEPATIAAAAAKAEGSARQAMGRLSPAAHAVGSLIDAAVAGLPQPDPRVVAKLAEALGGRGGEEAFDALHRALFAWLAERARRADISLAARGATAELWARLRDTARETAALNLDRKLHVLSVFAEFSDSARRL